MASHLCCLKNTTERRRSQFRRLSVGTSRRLGSRTKGTTADRRPGRPCGTCNVPGKSIVMIKPYLILAILPASLAANAVCMTDQPEIGDIGPSSELVCEALALRFPDAAMAVEDRSIRSPTAVSVDASVDGKPISLPYVLSGYTWRLDEPGARIVDVPVTQAGLPLLGK
jgi:hypothetical protein